MTGVETRRLAGGGVSYLARVRRGGVNRSAVFNTPEEAAAWRAATIAALRTGAALPEPPRSVLTLPKASVTVEDACREYVRGMRSGQIRTRSGHPYKASTVRGHENRLRLYVIPLLGGAPLAAVTRGDVRRLIEQVSIMASQPTAVNVRDAFRLVLQRQLDLEVIPANPAAGVRASHGERTPPRFLTPEEADRLQAAADAHRNPQIGTLVAFALATGLRLGELQAVAWGTGGLDVDNRLVSVTGTRDQRGQIVPPKSRRPRDVPIGGELVARLLRYRLAAGRPADGERVFPRSHRSSWEKVRDAAKLDGLRVHDLRHTAATFWLAAGLTVHAVADLLGHTDAALVLRLYGHALPAEKASAAERLEQWRLAQRR